MKLSQLSSHVLIHSCPANYSHPTVQATPVQQPRQRPWRWSCPRCRAADAGLKYIAAQRQWAYPSPAPSCQGQGPPASEYCPTGPSVRRGCRPAALHIQHSGRRLPLERDLRFDAHGRAADGTRGARRRFHDGLAVPSGEAVAAELVLACGRGAGGRGRTRTQTHIHGGNGVGTGAGEQVAGGRVRQAHTHSG
jgi:hypothetical protein